MNFDFLHPNRQNDPESLFRLFVATAVISLVMIFLFSVFSFYRLFSGFVISSAKTDSVQLCDLLVKHQGLFLFHNIPGQKVQLALNQKDQSRLDRSMNDFIEHFDVLKIKVYDINQRIIYSTEAQLIGKTDQNNSRLKNALAGNVDAKLETKEEARDLPEEQPFDVDVVETYVPIRDKVGKVLGSYEVYINVTKYRDQIKDSVICMTTILVLIELFFFVLSYRIIRRGARQLSLAQSKLEIVAITDALTGIANRGHVIARGEEEFLRAARNMEKNPQGLGLACIMLDIDHFKDINDTRGHLAGDEVLREVALRLRRSARQYDIIGRYGGEEFLMLMPDTSFEQALAVAERIRMDIRSRPFYIDSGEVNVSISLGVSCLKEDDQKINDLLKRADEGLYLAKDRGRDRVEFCQFFASTAYA